MASQKCFCDMYRDSQANPEMRISTPRGNISGAEFIEKADQICTGTRVYVGDLALIAGNVVVEDDTVTLPRGSVIFQCEYWVAATGGFQ